MVIDPIRRREPVARVSQPDSGVVLESPARRQPEAVIADRQDQFAFLAPRCHIDFADAGQFAKAVRDRILHQRL